MEEQSNMISMEEKLLMKYFEKPAPNDTDHKKLMITEIMEVIADKNNNLNFNNSVYQLIGMALYKHGFRRISYKHPRTNNPAWGWIVKQRS